MVASTNKDKLTEYEALFKAYPHVSFKPLSEIVWNPSSLSLVEEGGKSYYDNAYNKGRIAHMAAKYPTLSDDTGLEVDALDGRPGIRSHRYAIPRAGETQDMANIKKLLKELDGVPKEKRTARFVCSLVFFVEGVVLSASATLDGLILETARGTRGFGYDPVFLPNGSDKTLAELTLEEKNKISHRSKALQDIMAQIKAKHVNLVRP
jgi:XTP/dITP diphosphohydrolase